MNTKTILFEQCPDCGYQAGDVLVVEAEREELAALRNKSFNDYQKFCVGRAGKKSLDFAILGLGVAGEAGEVADLIKKHLGHGHTLDRNKLANELGDVLWYVGVLAYMAGFSLSEIAEINKAKLVSRYPNGFEESRSINRAPEAPTTCPGCFGRGYTRWDDRPDEDCGQCGGTGTKGGGSP